ncbi:1-deoxy-D-xylulose-5-phosphate synthase [Chloroflexota bacterium]
MLDSLNSPDDLKNLSFKELSELADEIRNEMVSTVSSTGGHLASSLGVVELTLALHRVFDSPNDKIVWDVGHQSYAHKLVTGRYQDFHTMRQYGGISGFPVRGESPHDVFGAGHASTSISAALGMALARDLKGESGHVLAVIGDGALGGGMAFEALNHAGHLGSKLIVVLNDNGFAISPSIGAVARLLNRMRLNPKYKQAKEDAKKAITSLPFGESTWLLSKRLKDGFKRTVMPNAFWEELGFTYLGPIDGHSIRELEALLSMARDQGDGPMLVHILTEKGKGHPPAEADATKFHGVSPANNKGGSAPGYSEVFGNAVLRLMRDDNRIVAITAAMLDGTGLNIPADEFPDRVLDVGICEQHAVTLSAGLATQGFVPVVAVYSTFLQRAYDQIIHDVCVQNLPVVFAIDRAGIVGEDGKTHQGAFDLSYLSSIPNMVVAAPKDENELQNLLYSAVNSGCPMAIRYPRGSGLGVPVDTELRKIPLGKGELLKQGKDVVVIALGSTVKAALEAAELLANEGIECAVVNARFAKPLDSDLILEMAEKTKRVLVVEESAPSGGLGSAVLRLLSEAGIAGVQAECIALPDEFIAHGPQEVFRALSDLDPAGITRRVKSAFPDLISRIATEQHEVNR